MKQNWFFYVMCGAIALFGIVLFVMPAKAQVQHLMLCDTAEQIETMYQAYEAGIPLHETQDAINKAAGSNACGMAPVVAQPIETVKNVTLEGNTYIIVKVIIVAVFDGSGLKPVPHMEQYAMMRGKDDVGA